MASGYGRYTKKKDQWHYVTEAIMAVLPVGADYEAVMKSLGWTGIEEKLTTTELRCFEDFLRVFASECKR